MTTSPYSFQISSGESNDVPEPDARHALAGEADPADALPAFEHGIITNADRTQLQHILASFFVPSWQRQRRYRPSILAGGGRSWHDLRLSQAHGLRCYGTICKAIARA